MTNFNRRAATLMLAASSFLPAFASAQDAPVTIDAVAVSLGGITMRSGTTPITIHIDRWSTDEDWNRLTSAVTENGDDALIDALRRAKPVGNLSTTGNLGWDIHYARAEALSAGGYRILFATDRPMSFAERTSALRSSRYEYLVGEVRVGADGKGQGTLVTRASVLYDDENKTLTVENYDSDPLRLSNVRMAARK